MSMVTLRTEPQSYVMAFSNQLVDLGLSKSMRLDDVVKRCEDAEFGATMVKNGSNPLRERGYTWNMTTNW